MTSFMRRRFSVAAPGTDQYRDNYEQTFKKDPEKPQHRHGGVTACTAPSDVAIGGPGCTCGSPERRRAEDPSCPVEPADERDFDVAVLTTKERTEIALDALAFAQVLLGQLQACHLRLGPGAGNVADAGALVQKAIAAVEPLGAGPIRPTSALLNRFLKITEQAWGPLMEIDDVRLDRLWEALRTDLGISEAPLPTTPLCGARINDQGRELSCHLSPGHAGVLHAHPDCSCGCWEETIALRPAPDRPCAERQTQHPARHRFVIDGAIRRGRWRCAICGREEQEHPPQASATQVVDVLDLADAMLGELQRWLRIQHLPTGEVEEAFEQVREARTSICIGPLGKTLEQARREVYEQPVVELRIINRIAKAVESWLLASTNGEGLSPLAFEQLEVLIGRAIGIEPVEAALPPPGKGRIDL